MAGLAGLVSCDLLPQALAEDFLNPSLMGAVRFDRCARVTRASAERFPGPRLHWVPHLGGLALLALLSLIRHTVTTTELCWTWPSGGQSFGRSHKQISTALLLLLPGPVLMDVLET